MSAGEIVAAWIIADKEPLARTLTERLYAAMPELLERHGEYGRRKCLEDMRYNLEHLAPAIALDEPALFAGYARWLTAMLNARNVGTDEIVRSLELTRSLLAERLTGADAALAERCLAAGLAAAAGE